MEPVSRHEAEDHHRYLTQDTPAVTHHVFADATVAGQGTVVTADGRMVHESAQEFLGGGYAPDGFAAVPGGKFRLNPTIHRAVSTPSLLAQRPWADNFGHFLVDAAALVTLADRLALPSGWQIVIAHFADPRTRAIAHEVLGVLARGVPVVEHGNAEVWRFEQLHYVSPVQVPSAMKRPETLAMLRAALLRGYGERAVANRRLFVSRGPDALRKLDNEHEVAAICRARGFEVVRPDLEPMGEQAALFRSAAFVVGVKGAALTNLMFGPAGSTALVLTPGDFPDPFFWDVCAQTGIRYAEMAGVRTTNLPRGHNSFRIDPARFASLLDRLLGSV